MDVLPRLPYLVGLLNRMVIKAIAPSRPSFAPRELNMELIHQRSAPNLDAFL